jgi:hypothetical protein
MYKSGKEKKILRDPLSYPPSMFPSQIPPLASLRRKDGRTLVCCDECRVYHDNPRTHIRTCAARPHANVQYRHGTGLVTVCLTRQGSDNMFKCLACGKEKKSRDKMQVSNSTRLCGLA